MTYKRQWDGTEWQQYSLRLAQLRHEPHNVQQVPDKVRGDCGIEFFALNGCLYQCYAPEEIFDTAKAASGMKVKARNDLNKISKYKETIAEILVSLKVSRWILLCPFLDDKDVVAYVREKGAKLKTAGLSFIANDFEALVQSQSDFELEIATLRLRSLGPAVKVIPPSDKDILASYSNQLGKRLEEKLARAFPHLSVEERESRGLQYVRSLLIRDNTLETLRADHPVLWERSRNCLEAEEQRLSALGNGEGRPAAQLRESLERIENSLKQDLRDLPSSMITSMSTGTVGDWLIRCPLDFPGSSET
jgi:hypothetical protein